MCATLELPLPSLSEGCFLSIPAMTDEALFQATGVRIAFLQRAGGTSQGPYASLNTGKHVDDDPDHVAANIQCIRNAFVHEGYPLITPKQVHGNSIFCYRGESVGTDVEADGVAVSVSKVGALLSFADCVPLILVAPSGAFAVVHAGWRGVVSEVVIESLKALADLSDRAFERGFCARCNVYIGPYIHGECFEVNEEVHGQFVKQFGTTCIYDETHIDLGKALRVSLGRYGIEQGRIADVDACTVCNNETYFSYRKSGGVCGRHGAFAVRYEGEL